MSADVSQPWGVTTDIDVDPYETTPVEPTPEPTPQPDPEPTTTPARRRAKRPSRNVLLRVAEEAVRLVGLAESDRDGLAVLLGVPAGDVAGLAVAVVERGKQAGQPVDDILAVADADGMDALMDAIARAEDRERFREAWKVLATVAAGLPERVPSKPVQAGHAFAQAARGLSQADRDVLVRPLSLLD